MKEYLFFHFIMAQILNWTSTNSQWLVCLLYCLHSLYISWWLHLSFVGFFFFLWSGGADWLHILLGIISGLLLLVVVVGLVVCFYRRRVRTKRLAGNEEHELTGVRHNGHGKSFSLMSFFIVLSYTTSRFNKFSCFSSVFFFFKFCFLRVTWLQFCYDYWWQIIRCGQVTLNILNVLFHNKFIVQNIH